MEKVIKKDFRPTKDFKLPISGITLTCFPSILVSEVNEVNKNPDSSTLDKTLVILAKAVDSWNYYNAETDEKPLAITGENFMSLPSTDVDWLVSEWSKWADELKKKGNS